VYLIETISETFYILLLMK